jgi:hypothetical protein
MYRVCLYSFRAWPSSRVDPMTRSHPGSSPIYFFCQEPPSHLTGFGKNDMYSRALAALIYGSSHILMSCRTKFVPSWLVMQPNIEITVEYILFREIGLS